MAKIEDVLDELAGDFKATSREPTTGAAESVILQTLASTFIKRAAQIRADAAEEGVAEERRQAAEAAAAARPKVKAGV
jgi:hypothetical protein